MQDIQSLLGALRRPRLLVRAARYGAVEYQRDAHLPRLLGAPGPTRHGAALLRLMELEAEIDAGRLARAAGYSAARHVEVLAAIIGEARALQAPA
ncbi:DUF6477 family protein [Alloyangia pacifica]|uniref:Uncharacterized protein n=1 Tax=Alloyangia pacifica TaxID=311180 RepID=A0A1I6P2Y2_9RHOB|nr:DUF6477 family protein [Alloyangia pacifica]SDH52965.1 hypothetical protein SAMN04488245_10829 [Alloyangia pacifica]SFS34448.1 hypothetical protein SAMN04488050_101274 [Alloyangia pacifica]